MISVSERSLVLVLPLLHEKTLPMPHQQGEHGLYYSPPFRHRRIPSISHWLAPKSKFRVSYIQRVENRHHCQSVNIVPRISPVSKQQTNFQMVEASEGHSHSRWPDHKLAA